MKPTGSIAMAIMGFAAHFADARADDTGGRAFTQQQIVVIETAVQQILRSEQKLFALSSAGVAVFDRKGLVWVGAIGFADQEQHVPAGADSLFAAGRLLDSLSSDHEPNIAVDGSHPIAYAELQSYDAPHVPAPELQPSGSLITSLREVASVGSASLADTESRTGAKLKQVSRSGAACGFVSKLSLLPNAGFGVVAYAALDHSSAAAQISEYALHVAVAVHDQKPLPADPTSRALEPAEALPLVGEYRHNQATVEVRWMGGVAYIETPRIAGRLRHAAAGYVVDEYTQPLKLEIDPRGRWLEADGIRYEHGGHLKPSAPDAKVVGLIGDYGSDHDSVRVFERDGTLFLRTGGVLYDAMVRETADVWHFPQGSTTHPGGQVRFSRDPQGRGTSFEWNNVSFPRRNIIIDPPAGKLSEADRGALRREAMAATPPKETEARAAADLVSVRSIDHAIKLDVRYATSQNLLGFPVYTKSAAYLQRPAAEALARADQKLHAQGFGIVVFDAYRPWFVTKMFWDGTSTEAHVFVADPGEGSRHNRGAAVDISLIDLASGKEVPMTGAYDEFSPRSYPRYDGGTAEQRWRRDVLREALESENFAVYPFEWWHFDYAEWRRYGLQNTEFEKLPN
jgi:D-alanyl-D-alanine dipeptidase